MGSMDVGSGPGVKSVGKDSTAGARRTVDYGQNPNSFGGGPGGVQGAGGGQGSAAYPQGAMTRSGAPASTGNTQDGSPGGEGGVKSVAADGGGRGSPGAAPAPASARKLAQVGGAPQDQNARAAASVDAMGSTSPQELANRGGFEGARPDGRPAGAERPA